jgi:hypothetical protein
MLYSALVMAAIVISSVVSLRETLQRICDRNDTSFEYDIAQIAFAMTYVCLIVVPSLRLLEYGKATRFINDWGNLQVTT